MFKMYLTWIGCRTKIYSVKINKQNNNSKKRKELCLVNINKKLNFNKK